MIQLGKVYMTKQNNNKILRGESAESFFFSFWRLYNVLRFVYTCFTNKERPRKLRIIWKYILFIYGSLYFLSCLFYFILFFLFLFLFNNTCTASLLCQLKRPCIVLLLFCFFLFSASCRIDVPCPGFLCRVCAAVRRVKLTVKRWHQVAGGAFSNVK